MYSTGDVAKKFGVSLKSIQRLDESGQLPAKRNPLTNRRYYDHDDITKLTEIFNNKARQVSLKRDQSIDIHDHNSALVAAIASTCKAIRPELAKEFLEILPELNMSLSDNEDIAKYVNTTFRNTEFANTFLTDDDYKYIIFKTNFYIKRMNAPMPAILNTKPVVQQPAADPVPVEVNATPMQSLGLTLDQINSLDNAANSVLAGPEKTVSRFG